MRHAIATSTRFRNRAALGAALVLALLAPLSCANDMLTPDPPVTPPPPPPPPPPAPPCNPVVEALRLERYQEPSTLFEGREIAVLGTDIGVTAIAQLSCSTGVLPRLDWSVDDAGVLQIIPAGPSTPGQTVRGFTALSPGRAVITLDWGGRQSSMAVEVPPSPAIGRLQQLSASPSCGLNESGQMFCWGNINGLVSDSDAGVTGLCPFQTGVTCRPAPLRIELPVTLDQVPTGSGQLCGLADGVAWCWISSRDEPSRLQAVFGTAGLRSVSAGGRHSCGLTDQGTAFCWGDNTYGQLGNHTTVSSVSAVEVATTQRFASIAAGRWSTCAVTVEGALFCWGDGLIGAGPSEKCGYGGKTVPTPCRLVPTRLDPVLAGSDTVFRAVSMGEHACALSTTGRLFCWDGHPSTLGITSSSERVAVPTPVETPLRFESISVQGHTTCGLAPGGEAHCMQIAIGSIGNLFGPQPLPGGLRFRSISAGSQYTCGIALDGKAYCLGRNRNGQLGAGHRTDSPVPVLILGQTP